VRFLLTRIFQHYNDGTAVQREVKKIGIVQDETAIHPKQWFNKAPEKLNYYSLDTEIKKFKYGADKLKSDREYRCIVFLKKTNVPNFMVPSNLYGWVPKMLYVRYYRQADNYPDWCEDDGTGCGIMRLPLGGKTTGWQILKKYRAQQIFDEPIEKKFKWVQQLNHETGNITKRSAIDPAYLTSSVSMGVWVSIPLGFVTAKWWSAKLPKKYKSYWGSDQTFKWQQLFVQISSELSPTGISPESVGTYYAGAGTNEE